MTWQMNVDPLGNIALSALVAAIPIFFLFWALAIKRMKGQYAALGGTALAVAIAVGVYQMPVDLAALATRYGGVIMTGSDTSTNALFGKLQAVTAEKIGVDPVITMSANTCGGVCGKMISPQSIAVATGATGLVGRESDIFRFTFKHSIFLALIVGILHMLWSYVFPGIVPSYAKPVAAAAAAAPAAAAKIPLVINPDGLMWLGIFIGIVTLVTLSSRLLGANLVAATAGHDQVHFH